MSAYALPGLFPPIDTVPQSPKVTLNIGDSSVTVDESSPSNKNVPLHLQDHDEKYNNKSDIVSSGSGREFDEDSPTSTTNIGSILSSAAIVVKEAKIDPVRWIQYVTGSNPQQYAHQIGKTLRRRVSSIDNSSTTGISSTGKPNHSLVDLSSRSNTKAGNNSNKSQQNEAIEFELSITFKGRKYTAKRTMQCIMQLRDDLIKEMKKRRQWLLEKQDLSTSINPELRHENNKMDTLNAGIRFTQPYYFDFSRRSSDVVATQLEYDSKHSEAVQIPEIPPFTSGHDRSGLFGKGFTMLHAMVKSYVPIMENWLKNVMEIVPQDSECLMNFLWEPTTEIPSACFKSVLDSINSSNEKLVPSKFKSSTSLATLGSIKEIDRDTEDDDSEDGW